MEYKLPLISIIVPIYNAEKFLEDTLNSILNQTYKNFELILIDDGSKDNSLELCKHIADADERILVYHQENQGVSAARNTGIDIAKGKYICFIDSDDLVEPDMLECLVTNAESHSADISCCGLVQVALDGEVKHHYCHGEKECFTDMKELMYSFFTDPMFKEILYGPYNKIVRSEIVKSVKFNVNYTVAEDLLFNFECLEKTNIFYLENRELYKYIKRENSISTSNFSEKEFHYIYVADIFFEKAKNKYPELIDTVTVWNFQQKLNICRRLCCNKSFKKKYIHLYKTWKNFCKSNRKLVWKRITTKNKAEFIILMYCPILFVIINKFFH